MVAFRGLPDIQTVVCIKNQARQNFPDHREMQPVQDFRIGAHRTSPPLLRYPAAIDLGDNFCHQTHAAECDIIL